MCAQPHTPSSVQIRRAPCVLTSHASHVLEHIAYSAPKPCKQLAKCTFNCSRWQGCYVTNTIQQKARTFVRPSVRHASCHSRTLGAVHSLETCTIPKVSAALVSSLLPLNFRKTAGVVTATGAQHCTPPIAMRRTDSTAITTTRKNALNTPAATKMR